MRKTRTTVITAYILVMLSLIAMVTASYAWLGVSRIPYISDLNVNVMTESGLMIAPDENGKPGEWSYTLDASAFFENMVPLKPVTYSQDDFCKLVYSETGRADKVIPLTADNYNVKYPNGDKTSAAAKAAEEAGYMIAMDFWLKADGGASAVVFLTEPQETADGQMGKGTYAVGAPIWDDGTVSHENGGRGSETTLRMGFRCRDASPDATLKGTESFTIYEPNADLHPDTSIVGYQETKNVDGGPLIDSGRHIIQKGSTWEEQAPVLQDAVIYTVGEFVQNVPLLTIESGGMAKVTLYIWMEGQDVDCLARNVAQAASVIANIQFGVDADENQGTGIGRDPTVVWEEEE